MQTRHLFQEERLMMRLALISLVVLAVACGRSTDTPPDAPAAAPSAVAEAAPAPAPLWAVTEGIETPESAYFDPASGFIYVSQVAGAPDGRDGNGRIVKLDRNGSMVSATWITGLNAPKGLRSCQGTLWTADLDEVIGVSVSAGRITSRVKIAGAQFLNDVACGADGTVYVSDMLASRIHAVRNGAASTFAEGEDLEFPNGLLVDGDRLIVAAWGKPEPDFSTEVPGRLYALDLRTKQKTLITPMPFANMDGLESDGRGGYIVSDWLAGTILRVTPSGESQVVARFMPGTADIGVIPAAGTVLIPHMNENRVAAYNLPDAFR
jgi:sugar lactone lactonase YvrE